MTKFNFKNKNILYLYTFFTEKECDYFAKTFHIACDSCFFFCYLFLFEIKFGIITTSYSKRNNFYLNLVSQHAGGQKTVITN